MDYEEKYKETLERAKRLLGTSVAFDRFTIERIFPELKESEDERIRKDLMEWFEEFPDMIWRCHNKKDVITWLEKQREPLDKGEISDGFHTFNELYYYRMLYNAAFFNMLPKEWVHKSKKHNDGEECFGGGWFIVMANLPTGQISNHYELKDWDLFQIPEKERADKWDGHTPQEAAERLHNFLLEKKGEQKLADKTEPKFKVGDWVAYHRNDSSSETIQVYDIRDGRYYFTDNVHFSWSVKECDEKCHLWTLEDAKDGDVIIYDDGWSCIFKRIHGTWYSSYCFITDDGEFHTGYDRHDVGTTVNGNANPTTNEQRDVFFAKMKEAGYEWDAEKKELKKIEQQSVEWSEEDERMFELIDTTLFNASVNASLGTIRCPYDDARDFLESLKGRVQPHTKEWSEEDEHRIKDIIYFLDTTKKHYDASTEELDACIDWLKSKQNIGWKPSGEQMNALDSILRYNQVSVPYYRHILSLYDDLKKLTE